MDLKIEKIIKEKKYLELTTEELMYVQDWATNEMEFEQLKKVLITSPAIGPSKVQLKETKQKLDDLFKRTYGQSSTKVIPIKRYMSIAVSVAAMLVLSLWLWPSNQAVSNQRSANVDQLKGKESLKSNSTIIQKDELSAIDNTTIIESETDLRIAQNEPLEPIVLTENRIAEQVPASVMMRSDAEPVLHSDLLTFSDIKASRVELIQQNPLIFSVLHTSF